MKSIIHSIDSAISEIEKYSTIYELQDGAFSKSILVLRLIKQELIDEKEINVRLLRGFKDICTTTAIHFEDEDFSDPIFEIYNHLEKCIPGFAKLDLLRMDFGKGNPI